jgi:phosphoribosylformylglycinamidine synthase
MKSAVIVFPGSNCDRDLAVAFERISGRPTEMVWHRETELPDVDVIGLPGGFSYGDYLRTGAVSARSPIMAAVKRAADQGRFVLGICNGFQVLTESGLLPGALMRNAEIHFVCRDVPLIVENNRTPFTSGYAKGETIRVPVAHHDGNYFADSETLDRLEGEGRVAFRYGEPVNGSQRNIAGILNEKGNVLGMMPHPERAIEDAQGGTDGRRMFESLLDALVSA